MAKFNHPGIYVEEIPTFTPLQSIANTATFIGYTEIHQDLEGKNLRNIPTDISSVMDFENFFGKAQPEENIEIIDLSEGGRANISVRFRGMQSLHNLYYAIRMFFAQGGTSCKIVSVGTFKNIGKPLSVSEMIAGLDALKSEKSNLLITVPENQNFPEPDFYLLQQKILDFCKTQRSFAILDLPKTSEANYSSIIANYREKLISPSLSFGAVFFPDLITILNYSYCESFLQIKTADRTFSLLSIKESDPLLYKIYFDTLKQFFISLPPSSAVTGTIIKYDSDRGIWKSPSNIAVQGINALKINLTKFQQEALYIDASGKSINCMRKFTGKGILIWGARTLAGNDATYRYITVRRLVNMIENTILQSIKALVFSNNSSQTWAQVKSLISDYLWSLWKMGALLGSKPEQAFFVKCGLNETMTTRDIELGNLIIEIGIAPLKPAEFIILRITQKISD